MIPEKPSLVLHPGLPKCATSSIQRAFFIRDFALADQLGVACIGKKFLPRNGHPAVSELMYDRAGSHQQVQTNDYPPGRYFMSNEAVSGDAPFLALLGQRFDIERTVVTVRFPPLQALSNYRYSGWLSGDLSQIAASKEAGCYESSLDRFVAKMTLFANMPGALSVCPTERLDQPLLDRFCQTCYGTVPDLLSQKQYADSKQLNRSISWAFAHALWQEVSQIDPAIVKTWTRATVVKAAQNHVLPDGMPDRRPASGAQLDGDRIRAVLPHYLDFLLQHGLPESVAQEAVAVARKDLDRFLAVPPATAAETQILAGAAKQIVAIQMLPSPAD